MNDINMESEYIPAPKDGHQAADYYQWHRDNNRLKQSLYRQISTQYDLGPDGKAVRTERAYACALGAAFGAHSVDQCNVDITARWLVRLTPSFFDELPYGMHADWADAVYGKGGLVDRAADLSTPDRALFWDRLQGEVAARVRCAYKDSSSNLTGVNDESVIGWGACANMQSTGWTIVEVGEKFLTEAGV